MTGSHAPITEMRVFVIASSRTRGVLALGSSHYRCAIGRRGVSSFKQEGDGASPRGTFRIVGGYYRPDQFKVRPATAIPMKPMRRDDGWCDAPDHPAYNRLVRLPMKASHEAMWRDDRLYDLVLVLDWNIGPRRRHRGSAIFFHLARPDYAPTAGCVAVNRTDMIAIIARLTRHSRIRFG